MMWLAFLAGALATLVLYIAVTRVAGIGRRSGYPIPINHLRGGYFVLATLKHRGGSFGVIATSLSKYGQLIFVDFGGFSPQEGGHIFIDKGKVR